jgi:hypothetical protein
MFSFNDIRFRNVIQDPQYLSTLTEALKPADRSLADFEQFIDFVQKCHKDIELYDHACRGHYTLTTLLVADRARDPLPPEAADISRTFSDLVAFCACNPPVFRTTQKCPDCFSLTGVRFPWIGQPAVRVAIEADGSKEAVLRLLTLRGDSRQFLLLSPSLYRFTQREFYLVQTFSKIIQTHPTACTRQHFVYYPNSYLVHRRLLIVDARPGTTFRDIVRPWALCELLADSARRVVEPGLSPQSVRERRSLNIRDDLLLEWLIRGSESNKSNFLFLRSSFASHLAVVSAFQLLFGAHPLPPVLFMDDRQRICIPGSIGGASIVMHLPLTDQIQRMLPGFVLRGSFASTWQTVVNAIHKNVTKLTICLTALLPQDTAKRPSSRSMIMRVEKASVQTAREATKSDDEFPFKLLDHLIDISSNAFPAQTIRFGWV